MVEKTAKIAEKGKKMVEYGTSYIVSAFQIWYNNHL